jgi:hypothetical protein
VEVASKVMAVINGIFTIEAAYKEEGGAGHHTAVTAATVMDNRYWGSRKDTMEVPLNWSCYRLNAKVFLSFLFNEIILSNLK